MDFANNRLNVLICKTAIILIICNALFSKLSYGQADSVKEHKNTILLNITNPMLFGWKFNIIGYERVISKYQTISISIGRVSLPAFSYITDTLGLTNQYNDHGFHFSFDYRFYLQKENKYKAPRGIYIGPYYAYNQFSRDLDWTLNTSNSKGEVITGFDLKANFIGAQLGYQFVFWDRLSVDMVLMGPGLWHLNLKSHFNTTLSTEDEQMILDELNRMLKEKFPQSGFIFTGSGFEAKKTTTTNTVGFRYMINLGFRF